MQNQFSTVILQLIELLFTNIQISAFYNLRGNSRDYRANNYIV